MKNARTAAAMAEATIATEKEVDTPKRIGKTA